ncbi:MAG: nucleotidyltransferase family protein [Parcubacteria group bacterium]|nr:nucleotidyltransferase family protein [Parcubacteria group bacterium]
MKAVILAAGIGKRLRPLTNDLPKSLVPVKGVPILIRTLNALPQSITSAVIVIGYKGNKIRSAVGNSFNNRNIAYVAQPELLGTADALWRAQELLRDGHPFLVLNGDDYYTQDDLEAIVRFPYALGAKRDAGIPGRGYLPIFMNKDGFIEGWNEEILRADQHPSVIAIRIQEDPRSLLTNTGAYMLDQSIFSYKKVPIAGGEYGLPQTMLLLANDRPVRVVEMPDWMPLNTTEDLAALEATLTN